MTDLLAVPREEREVRAKEQPEDQGRPEPHPEPDLDIPIYPEDPEVKAEREVVLEVPPEWNAVPDLIMEDDEDLMITKTDTKQKRDEVAQGRRKRRKEDDISKCEDSPTVCRRTRNPAGFYSEDWDELQEEEDEWQMPDKWQRISQMVFVADVWR